MIHSYGIIAYTYIDNILYVLLVQRRDTFAFVDFMLGRSININEMCTDERQRLLKFNFKTIFEDFNCDRKFLKKNYFKSKNFFFKNIDDIILEIKNFKGKEFDQPWGFPKGRSKNEETPEQTAKREFFEETNVNVKNLENDKITQVYKGTNDKIYKSCFYPSKFNDKIEIPKITLNVGLRNNVVSNETLDCQWFTLQESYKLLDEHSKSILKQFELK